jgi:hypothetical protein
MKTIESWIGKHVRIKDEYITDECVNVAGLSAYFSGYERKTFKVQMDCYGVDLFPFRRESVEISAMPSPSHQIIIEETIGNYPFLWDAKYFELI